MSETEVGGTDRTSIEWHCVDMWARDDFPSDDLAKDLPLINELFGACDEDYALMVEKGGNTDHPIKLMKYVGAVGPGQNPRKEGE